MPQFEPVLLANIHKPDSHTRKVYEASGGYSALKKILKEKTPVEVIDLSSGGCRMRAKWTLTNGAKICLKVRHDEFPAEIVWVDGHEAGARFLEPVTIL